MRTEIDFKWICPNCETKNTIYDIGNDALITIITENLLDERCYKCGEYFETLQDEGGSDELSRNIK